MDNTIRTTSVRVRVRVRVRVHAMTVVLCVCVAQALSPRLSLACWAPPSPSLIPGQDCVASCLRPCARTHLLSGKPNVSTEVALEMLHVMSRMGQVPGFPARPLSACPARGSGAGEPLVALEWKVYRAVADEWARSLQSLGPLEPISDDGIGRLLKFVQGEGELPDSPCHCALCVSFLPQEPQAPQEPREHRAVLPTPDPSADLVWDTQDAAALWGVLQEEVSEDMAVPWDELVDRFSGEKSASASACASDDAAEWYPVSVFAGDDPTLCKEAVACVRVRGLLGAQTLRQALDLVQTALCCAAVECPALATGVAALHMVFGSPVRTWSIGPDAFPLTAMERVLLAVPAGAPVDALPQRLVVVLGPPPAQGGAVAKRQRIAAH